MIDIKMENSEEKIIDNDEIDLIVLWKIIWSDKIVILMLTALFAIASVSYALYLPNIYQADAVLYPSDLKSQTMRRNNTAGLQGIASLAGVNIVSGESAKTDFAIAVLESKSFITDFIKNHNLKAPLFAIKEWDEKTGNEIFDSALYNIDTKKWLINSETNESKEPTELEAYDRFVQNLSIFNDIETGIITVSYEFISPVRAKHWVDMLIRDLNNVVRDKDVLLANKSIAYLEVKLEETNVVDIKNMFFKLIEDQIRTRLLAETKNDYVFEIIDPPVIEEKKIKPSRALICIFGAFLGGIFSLLVVFIRHLWKKQ